MPILLLNRFVAPHSLKDQLIIVVRIRVGILVPQLTPLHQTKVRQLQESVVNKDSEKNKKG